MTIAALRWDKKTRVAREQLTMPPVEMCLRQLDAAFREVDLDGLEHKLMWTNGGIEEVEGGH